VVYALVRCGEKWKLYAERAGFCPIRIHDDFRDIFMNFDVTITAGDVRELSNADAITAFFARLGWRTDVRIEQSPAHSGCD